MHRAATLSLSLLFVACGEPKRAAFTSGTDAATGSDAAADGAPCTSGHTYCEGTSALFTCNDRGEVTTRSMCEAPNLTCVPELGCRVCRPNSTRCSPDNALRTQRCRDDGMGWDDGAMCSAEDGSACVAGVCTDRCSDSALGRSYLGCSYWPTVTANSGLDPMFGFAIVLANPQTYPVRATITGGALTEPRVLTLDPGAIETVDLPWVIPLVQLNPRCPRLGTRCLANDPARSVLARNGAYHVQTNGPVAAYQFNPLTYSIANTYYSYSNDASLLLPQGVLTRNYTVSTWPDQDSNDPTRAAFGGFVAVVATGGETTEVNVRSAGRVRAGNGVAAMGANQRATFTLAQGDVLELVGDGGGDLTGTTIQSSLPVAVFVGHDCTYVPRGRPACDHLEEQLLPDETWGRDYVVSALRDRGTSTPNVVRILSRVDDNQISFDPPTAHADVTLSRGEFVEFESREHFRVQGSGAFLVSQFMIGQGPAGTGSVGDPAMVLEVPSQQYRDRYDFFVPSTYPQNFINVVAPAGDSLTLDDTPLRGSMSPLGNFSVYTLPITSGAHRLRGSAGLGFGIKVYGVAPYTSYMYPGGLDLQLITPPG